VPPHGSAIKIRMKMRGVVIRIGFSVGSMVNPT
jgi:hypothetical protein